MCTEAGKGTVGVRDLQRAATAHNFIWTEKELLDMIRFFDSDGDAKVSISSFFNDFCIWLEH